MIRNKCPVCDFKFTIPEIIQSTISNASVCYKCRMYGCGMGPALYTQSLLIDGKWVHEIWRESHTKQESTQVDVRFIISVNQARIEYENAKSEVPDLRQ